MYQGALAQAKSLLSRRFSKSARSLKKAKFNILLRSRTKKDRTKILQVAEQALSRREIFEIEEQYNLSTDPVVQQGWILKKAVESDFRNKLHQEGRIRIVVQVPSAEFSPAGFSLFNNFAESFSFLGIPTRVLEWDQDLAPVLFDFCPNVLLVSDHPAYLSRISWSTLKEYRKSARLLLGLSASIEAYGNSPLIDRLQWAKQHDVSFYFTYRDQGYIKKRPDYHPFFSNGYPMLYLPFGANILHYYPVPGFQRDLNYAVIATRKREHIDYLASIASRYDGFIDGPGWTHIRNFTFNRDRDRYIYARTKIGLNVHQPDQLTYPCELNERNFQLAACGVPQLTDHAKLLDEIFPGEFFFVAENPVHYEKLFRELINNYDVAQKYALRAQIEVFAKHTTFHRAESFVRQLQALGI